MTWGRGPKHRCRRTNRQIGVQAECRTCASERVVSDGVEDTILRLGLADSGLGTLLQEEMNKATEEEDRDLDCARCKVRTACKVWSTFDQVRGRLSVVRGH